MAALSSHAGGKLQCSTDRVCFERGRVPVCGRWQGGTGGSRAEAPGRHKGCCRRVLPSEARALPRLQITPRPRTAEPPDHARPPYLLPPMPVSLHPLKSTPVLHTPLHALPPPASSLLHPPCCLPAICSAACHLGRQKEQTAGARRHCMHAQWLAGGVSPRRLLQSPGLRRLALAPKLAQEAARLHRRHRRLAALVADLAARTVQRLARGEREGVERGGKRGRDAGCRAAELLPTLPPARPGVHKGGLGGWVGGRQPAGVLGGIGMHSGCSTVMPYPSVAIFPSTPAPWCRSKHPRRRRRRQRQQQHTPAPWCRRSAPRR